MPIIDFNSSLWTDPWARSLTPELRDGFIYLWTNPAKNIIAMYHLDIELMAFQRNTTEAKCLDTVMELFPSVKYDEDSGMVWVVKHFRHQYMRRSNHLSPKVLQSVKNNLFALRGHPFVFEFFDEYKELNLNDFRKEYPYPLVTLSKPMGNSTVSRKGKGRGRGRGKSFQKTISKDNTVCSPTDYSPEFEELWKLYPSNPNASKQAANIKYEKLSDGDKLELAIAVKNFSAYIDGLMPKDRIGIKHFENFIYDGRVKISLWREWVSPEKTQTQTEGVIFPKKPMEVQE